MPNFVPEPARIGGNAKGFRGGSISSVPWLACASRQIGQGQMNLDKMRIAGRKRTLKIIGKALDSNTRVDGLAVLAGPWPDPRAVVNLHWQWRDAEIIRRR